MISSFVSKKVNNTLESYLRDEDKAWTEDLDGETRVYLVKDKFENIGNREAIWHEFSDI